MKRYLLIFTLLCWHTMALASLTMQIDPANAKPGETLRLTLTLTDDTQSRDVPDLTPLEKDFNVVGTEHNMSYTAVNGVAKSESQWVVLLTAKSSGTLSIPPIRIGQHYSQPGQVNITTTVKSTGDDDNQTESSATEDDDDTVLLHASASEKKAFINQQVIYTVKLLTRQSLLDAQYQPPQVEDALMIPIGNGRRYQTTLNGQEYGVDEQQYAIFPQKSGELHITPPKLTAVIYNTEPKRINIEGNSTKFMVKPIPEKNGNKKWLPAKQLTLTDQYDSSAPTAAEGSTLIRTITIQATGLPAELLPALTFADNKQFSVYPEKPEVRDILRQQEIIGTSTTKVTYILNQAGNVSLPAINISWFNTQTGEFETATLPGRELTVTNKAGTTTPPPPPAIVQQQPQSPGNVAPQPVVYAPSELTHSMAWWIAAGFALAWLLTLGLWWAFRHRNIMPKRSMRSIRSRLRDACMKNDPARAQAALMEWSRAQWPEAAPLNLRELGTLVRDVVFKTQIDLLLKALYSENGLSAWRGDALWNSIEGYRPLRGTQKFKRQILPQINPEMDPFT